ncbi:metalloregulator ArsR/SmtB family transcription factor [Rhodobacterales bacterium HKCCE2091]|nr:metalloregulator ArsR/SmtB family transcription factor [Rhodobacterales bacterium HKCCE2091]
MVERNEADPLSRVLKAASDPTRRDILTFLAQEGAQRVTTIAGRFDISLNAVSKHIKVLEQAGLVSRRTQWREHLIEVRMDPLSKVDAWFDGLRSIWAMRLEALDHVLQQEAAQDDDRD